MITLPLIVCFPTQENKVAFRCLSDGVTPFPIIIFPKLFEWVVGRKNPATVESLTLRNVVFVRIVKEDFKSTKALAFRLRRFSFRNEAFESCHDDRGQLVSGEFPGAVPDFGVLISNVESLVHDMQMYHA